MEEVYNGLVELKESIRKCNQMLLELQENYRSLSDRVNELEKQIKFQNLIKRGETL